MQQPPYVPRTGLASGAPPTQQLGVDQFAQKPVNLFDPNFLQQNQSQQLNRDINVVENIFGAQNQSNISAASGSADLSHMSERDRRIYLRDLERKNRLQGGKTAQTASYGVAEPPPVQSTGANIFGDAPVASKTRDQIFNEKMAQRQSSQNGPPSSYQPLQVPSQGQGGFNQAPQLNQPMNQMPQMMPPPSGGLLAPPSGGAMPSYPSPNTNHRKLKSSAIGQSPLRNSNILTAAHQQQSPMRSSLTAQKLQQAKELDQNIQYDNYNPYAQQQQQPMQQVLSQRVGLPPSGASPMVRKDKAVGLLDALGNNEFDLKRKQDTRAMQQYEYNKYLANQQQPMQPQRQRSASGRIIADVNSSLTAGGMQLIGGHQVKQQEDKQRMQLEYQQMLNQQMQYKQQQEQGRVQLSENRKKQISDQVFQELMQESGISHQGGQVVGNLSQMIQAPQQNLPYINQPMQQANRNALPPRTQSAVGSNRKQEVQKLQRGTDGEDPFHRNRANQQNEREIELAKKREYAAILQQQMAQKKHSTSDRGSQLPPPDQLFEQHQPPQQQAQNMNNYPSQMVNFSQQPPQQPPAQNYSQFEPPKYSMAQSVDFTPPQMAMQPPSYQGMPPPPGGNQFPQMPPQNVSQSYDPYQAVPPSQRQSYSPSRAPEHPSQQAPSLHPNNPSNTAEQSKLQQKSRQDEYRRQLAEQVQSNDAKKRKLKEDQRVYEQNNAKDMAEYMGVAQNPSKPGRGQAQPIDDGGYQPTIQQPPPGYNQVSSQFPGFAGGDQPMQGASNPTGPVPGGGVGQGQSAIRVGTDITKRQEEVDPAKLQAKMNYQEELKQQMEEAKRRKESAKMKEKQQDEELERRIHVQQQKLTQQEIDEIKREGKRDAPEVKQTGKQIRRDQFMTSDESKGKPSSPIPSTSLNEPPTLSKGDQFTKPNPVDYQPLQLNAADNFTLQGPAKSFDHQTSNDLFGKPPVPISLLPPPTDAPGFPSMATPTGGMAPPPGFPSGPPTGFPSGPPTGFPSGPPTGFPSGPPTQYSQFGHGALPAHPNFNPPQSAPMQNQQMQTQSDWMAAQSNQAGKMFDDQQKMIGMYQQALEQILQYRNQYFEQAMSMRENILKEREQLLENEKLKQQQISEMQQIQAVKSQLGNMMNLADQQQVLNPQVTDNLNQYINKQKQQILQMSQSSQNMQKIIRDANLQQQQQQQQPHPYQVQTPLSQEKELPVTSQRIEIPRHSLDQMPISNPQQVNFSPPIDDGELDLQKQVDELAAQIAANDVDQQNRSLTEIQQQRLSGHYPLPQQDTSIEQQSYGQFQRNPEFEKSLSSESKMVKVPLNNLQAVAAQAVQTSQQSAAKSDHLIETWNEQSANKALDREGVLSPGRAQATTPIVLDGQRMIATPKRIGGNLINNPRSPMHSNSVVPQTIQELPHEEEKPQNNVDGMRASGFDFQTQVEHRPQKSEYDFNNRALSGTSSPPRQNLVSLDAKEDMEKIERLVQLQTQQTQSAWVDRRATMTGTSFYDNHRQTQKLQEQTREEEMQKQLMRILGSTGQSASGDKEDPLKAMQQAYGPETDRDKNENDHVTQHSSTVKVRASQDKMVNNPFSQLHAAAEGMKDYGQQPLGPQESARPSQKTNQTGSEINIAATDQSDNIRQMMQGASSPREYQGINESAEQVNESKRTFQPSDLINDSRMTDMMPSTDRARWGAPNAATIKVSQDQEASIWDDPDMVPVPVLPTFSDNSMTYEPHDANDNSMKSRVMPPSANGNQPYYGHSIAHTDNTIAGLQMMVPELIATTDFSAEQILDETAGDQHSYEHQHRQQQFQTYKQSEPMMQDENASRISISKHERQTVDQQSAILTQIEASQNEDKPMPSARSQKEQELAEIEEIIRKVTNTAAVTEQKVKEQVARRRNTDIPQKSLNQNIATPSAHSTGKSKLIEGETNEAPKMQTAAANVAPHRLGQMQRAADEMEQPPVPVVNNDQQILSDLDKIIANLELQQKNMATFGIPVKGDEEDPAEEDEEKSQNVFNDNKIIEEEDEGQKTGRSQWTSLAKVREERAQGQNGAPPLPDNARPVSSKAPLDPKSQRPKSGRSIKSRNTSAKGRSGIDASPQRVGKYAQMALQNQNDGQNTSVKSQSRIDSSPQRVGKYAMLALQNQNAGQNTSNMGSPSPQKIGKFAQMALQKSPQVPKGQEVDNISQKYGRNPSRERLEERSMMSNANNESRLSQLQQMQTPGMAQGGTPTGGSILRPVSGKSNNSRYYNATAGRPSPSIAQTVKHDQESIGAFHQTTRTAGQMTQGTVVKGNGVDQRHNTSKIAYYSDEDEDGNQREPRKPQFSESGRTQKTAGQAKTRFHIADDEDNVNF